MPKKLLTLCALFLAAGNASACFTVYNEHDRVVYQDLVAPVDMSRALHETIPVRFGAGARMVFDNSGSCPVLRLAQLARPRGGDVPEGSVEWVKNVKTRPLLGSTED